MVFAHIREIIGTAIFGLFWARSHRCYAVTLKIGFLGTSAHFLTVEDPNGLQWNVLSARRWNFFCPPQIHDIQKWCLKKKRYTDVKNLPVLGHLSSPPRPRKRWTYFCWCSVAVCSQYLALLYFIFPAFGTHQFPTSWFHDTFWLIERKGLRWPDTIFLTTFPLSEGLAEK